MELAGLAGGLSATKSTRESSRLPAAGELSETASERGLAVSEIAGELAIEGGQERETESGEYRRDESILGEFPVDEWSALDGEKTGGDKEGESLGMRLNPEGNSSCDCLKRRNWRKETPEWQAVS